MNQMGSKIHWPVLICLVTIIVSAPPAGFAAALYPGETKKGPQREEWIEGVAASMMYQTYYARDDFDQVVEYYGRRLKQVFRESDAVYFDQVDDGSSQYAAVIVLRRRSGLSQATLFDPLADELTKASAGIIQGLQHDENDLDALKARYGYLARFAFFPDYPAKEKLRTCQGKIDSGTRSATSDVESYGRKAEELARQGRFAELQQLIATQGLGAQAGMQQTLAVSHWDEWVACLDDLDRHAYRAEIWIRSK